ncbi:TadE family protein [Botrimarina mediterranea]|uniref:TadE-like protein n=2 Tax=Botrimarina mediterranea TaxID=2528022 RepID=A0A518K8D1_9BACT|nr:TadE/TadG family type IV pilus assembly protein [Botrimarina mediterranea]QDV74049.1 TadE-like protein [Botrimarina mediterranea]QDV78679.1 TadE-like protein [Planctomycetes bacterium K2D]
MYANRPRPRRRSRQTDRRGAAVVEFAIVAPLFFLMILGCIEIGRALMVQQVLVNASRVGAREAATLNGTSAGAVTSAVNYAAGASVPGVTATVSPDPGTAKGGDLITMTLTVDFLSVSWSPTPWFLGGQTLTATSVMRKEGFN